MEMKKKFYLLANTSKPSGYSGECLGAEYDMANACPNCGTGYKLIGNLPVKAVKLEKDFIQTLDRDYLISDKLFSALNLADIKVENLLHAINSKSKEELRYYHLKPDFSFPKMLPESEGITTDEQCPICKRNGFFGDVVFAKNDKGEIESGSIVPAKYKYQIESADFLEQADFYSTWEHFGTSNLVAKGNKVIGYARPLLIVSERVKSVFENMNIKNVSFEEIFIQEK